jgi:peptidoglycan L-alanyl-D-glutamate endopeptidase CwlK
MKPEALPVEKRHSRTDLLAPFVEDLLLKGLDICKERGLDVSVFETYRSPDRQNYLYAQGRTRPGKIVTRAPAWQSWHQYSLACDLVFGSGKNIYWPNADDAIWDKVHAVFEPLGFETISWEKPHIQITAGLSTKEAYRIAKDQGILALWSVVELKTR